MIIFVEIELSKMWLSSAQWNSLLYWDNPRDSGIICGSILVCLLAVRYISLIRSVLYLLTSKTMHHLADMLQCDWQPVPGPRHGHHELQDLQVRADGCQQDSRWAPL